MDRETLFRTLFWILFGGVLAMRTYFSLQVRRAGERLLPDRAAIQREGRGAFAVRFVAFFALRALYALNVPWLAGLSIPLPPWLRWTGFVLGLASLAWWTWTQAALGTQWSTQLQLREEQDRPVFPALLPPWEPSRRDRKVNMPKIRLQSENAVAETLLLLLYAHALETQQPMPLVRDDRAAALAAQIDYDFSRFRLTRQDQVMSIMRLRELDRRAQDFLARHSQAVVVHIGCGLDTRFERVDNGQVEWYDLDLPEVIALRRQLIAESARCHVLACSVLEKSWLDTVSSNSLRPAVFLADGVFPCFEEAQVRSLFLTFKERFPGAELVCDAITPLMVRLLNLNLRFFKVGAPALGPCARPRSRELRRTYPCAATSAVQVSVCWMNGPTSTARSHAWAQPA